MQVAHRQKEQQADRATDLPDIHLVKPMLAGKSFREVFTVPLHIWEPLLAGRRACPFNMNFSHGKHPTSVRLKRFNSIENLRD